MLAERGERLDESVDYLKKALQIEPEQRRRISTASAGRTSRPTSSISPETNLRRAAEQLRTNSVIQEHYGEVLFKLGRYDEAIAAWNRALAGDGDSIDRGRHRQEDQGREAEAPRK